MNSAAVNLGAGGFVSYFEDGGATVVLGGEQLPPPVQEEFEERGVGTFFAEQYTPFMDPPEGARFDADRQSEIRASGNPGSAARETYYPEGNTF